MKIEEKPKKLLDLVKEKCRYKHYSLRTEQSYCGWVKRFVLFHNKRHPHEMGAAEVTGYLSYLPINKAFQVLRISKHFQRCFFCIKKF